LILDTLDETGLANDTLVIFTTDHGPGLPGVKVNLNDRGLGVALILRGPRSANSGLAGDFTGGKVIEGQVSHLDLYPTLCEVLGLDPPDGLEGKSLLPILQEPAESLHRELFFEQSYHGRYVPLRSVRTERYRYVRRLGPDQAALDFSADGGDAFDLLQQSGLGRIVMPCEQLFELVRDPQESVNLIDDPVYAEVAADLRRCLDRWMERTDDPARHDAIPKPPPRPASDPERVRGKHRSMEKWRRLMDELWKRDSGAGR
jgi:arylsulfatase A-like enzyme